eukprot:4258018-Pyramimonas_sp.AAC.2
MPCVLRPWHGWFVAQSICGRRATVFLTLDRVYCTYVSPPCIQSTTAATTTTRCPGPSDDVKLRRCAQDYGMLLST